MAFSVASTTTNGFDTIILKDAETQTSVEIIPACGAILHGFTILQNDQFLNVIDHYNDAADFATCVESKGFKSCKLSPFACRIKNARYNFREEKYTLDKFKIDGNALHGLLYDAVFTVTDQQADEQQASVILTHHYIGTSKGYPFYYDCIVTYLLQKNNTLTITTTIVNQDEKTIPMQDGWHPYFTFGGPINELQLAFQSTEKILFDDSMVPSGDTIPYQQYSEFAAINETIFDDCFTVNFAKGQPVCVLKDAIKKIQLTIEPDESYPYLQLYTPPHRSSIAIENLSAVPDAFNNGIGLITLAPKATKIFTTSYKITLLK